MANKKISALTGKDTPEVTDVVIIEDATGVCKKVALSAIRTDWTGSGVAEVLNKPTLFDGAYASLTGAPSIPADVSDLTDTTNLLFDGAYASLTEAPSVWQIVETPPAAAIGATGDVANMVAYDATYVYFCTAAYDGETAIWARVALDFSWTV